jgi:hypothetical protein
MSRHVFTPDTQVSRSRISKRLQGQQETPRLYGLMRPLIAPPGIIDGLRKRLFTTAQEKKATVYLHEAAHIGFYLLRKEHLDEAYAASAHLREMSPTALAKALCANPPKCPSRNTAVVESIARRKDGSSRQFGVNLQSPELRDSQRLFLQRLANIAIDTRLYFAAGKTNIVFGNYEGSRGRAISPVLQDLATIFPADSRVQVGEIVPLFEPPLSMPE